MVKRGRSPEPRNRNKKVSAFPSKQKEPTKLLPRNKKKPKMQKSPDVQQIALKADPQPNVPKPKPVYRRSDTLDNVTLLESLNTEIVSLKEETDKTNQIAPRHGYLSTVCYKTFFGSDHEYRYGWFECRPRVLRHLNREWFILFCFSVASFVQGMAVNGFVNVVISNIEKRFHIPSTSSGLIASFYDIASVVCLIPVTYFGGMGHKPRYISTGIFIMGIGSLIFTLPHFLTGLYDVAPASVVCLSRNETLQCQKRTLTWYRNFFFAGQFLHGAGCAPLYSLATTYLDENLSRRKSPLYLGIFYGMSIFGPGLGYLMGGALLDVYTDINLVDTSRLTITPKSPEWVGAWWIGFLVSMSLAFIVSFPISGFPIALRDNYKQKSQKIQEVYKARNSDTVDDILTSNEPGLSHIFFSIKVLCTNPTFMFLNLAAACEGFFLSGLSTFAAKFLEIQFSLSASLASRLAGMAIIPTGGGGTLLGGYVVRRFDLKIPQMLRLSISCAVISLICNLAFIVPCPTMPFAGISVDYPKEKPQSYFNDTWPSYEKSTDLKRRYNLTTECNVRCRCDPDLYSPVCGDNDVVYFSPCFAGCSVSRIMGAEHSVEYANCSCIAASLNGTQRFGDAKRGNCKSKCNYLPLFLVVLSVGAFMTFLCSMPALQATLRSIPYHQRSLGLGIQWIIARCLGSIPGPIFFGSVMDTVCLEWRFNCHGEKSSCRYYDNLLMGKYLLGLTIGCKCLSTLFFTLSLFLYRPPPQDDIDDTPSTEQVLEYLPTECD